jgi:hypothetical protein
MKRKVKRYDVGGMTDEEGKKGIFGPKADKEEEDPRGTYFKSPRPTTRSSLPSAKESTGTSYGSASDSSSPASFKDAFAAARKSGDSSFTFGGKKYNTEMKSAVPKAASKASSSASSSPSPDVVRAAEANKRRIEASDKPLETVNPEAYLIGPGGGLKGLHALAKNLVTRGAEKTAEKATQKLAADNARQMLKDRAMAGTRAGQAAKEEADDLIRMGSDFMKKGGKVKAKPKMSYGGKVKKMSTGGKAKSASARADGCAIRGKTRA